MASISPINRVIEGHLVIAIRAYCDGSGSTADPNCNFLTLGACIATPVAWQTFETRWAIVQARHQSPPLHMKKAMHLRGDFEAWTMEQVDALLSDLHNECFAEVARRAHPDDFIFTNCTVNLADYRRAALQSSAVRALKPEALCTFHIVHVALTMLPDNAGKATQKDGFLEIWFDMNEPFQHFVQKEWERRKKRRRDILSHVATVAPGDYRDLIGLQAADFVAWHTSRHFTYGDSWPGFLNMAAAPNVLQYWDYDRLIAALPDGSS